MKWCGCDAARTRVAALERAAAEANAAEQERTEWGAVAAGPDIEATKAFLDRWPNGQHANAARTRLAALERAASWLGMANNRMMVLRHAHDTHQGVHLSKRPPRARRKQQAAAIVASCEYQQGVNVFTGLWRRSR